MPAGRTPTTHILKPGITRLVDGVRKQAGTYIASRRTELLDPTR